MKGKGNNVKCSVNFKVLGKYYQYYYYDISIIIVIIIIIIS